MCSQMGRDTGKSSAVVCYAAPVWFWHLLSVLRAAGGRRRRMCREDRAQRSERRIVLGWRRTSYMLHIMHRSTGCLLEGVAAARFWVVRASCCVMKA